MSSTSKSAGSAKPGRPRGRLQDAGTVTRQDLTNSVSAAIELSNRQASDVVDQILGSIMDQLAAGNDVLISGFGKFVTKQKRSRMGINPKTKEPLTISARRVMKFRPSAMLKRGLMAALTAKHEA